MSRSRRGSWRVLAVGLIAGLACLALASGSPVPPLTAPTPEAADRIAGLASLPPPPQDGPSWRARPLMAGGLRALATAGPTGFALHTAGGEVGFLPGVNVGGTTPGHQPGELAIDAADYRGWFGAMHWLGIRVVRIYTIHPPAFYTELAAHNRAHPDRPLYLMHGVHLPDDATYVKKGNLYDPATTAGFTQELREASAAASGKLTRTPAPGRASGTWTTDVGEWLAAWIVGLQWDPEAVAASDRANAAPARFTGRYFRSTVQASATERWLAGRMDELATAEAGHGRTMPIAFINWPTTDPLRHPEEPSDLQDLVGIDANHVQPTPAWPGGTFASYHLYPYHPDFLTQEPGLSAFRHAGRADPYAGYLQALRRHHTGMPMMVTEFGVPSSLGNAHAGALGRDQGDHDEHEAMKIDADLLRMIHDLGLAGALLFSWTDEWFKLTWNTLNHQMPANRRQLWHDVLTNEQHFGLVATDAVGPPDNALVDESYLHLSLPLPTPAPGRVTVGLDVLPGLTGDPPPGSTDRDADAAFALDLAARTGQAWLRTELDPLVLDYDAPAGMRPPPVNGWQRFQLVLNRERVVPTTNQRLPGEIFDAGVLRYGRWDPADAAADSRALWRVDGAELTMRVPWAMAGFGDPSSHQVLTVAGDRATPVTSPGVDVSVTDNTTLAARGPATAVTEIRWENWQQVRYAERLKRGAWQVRAALLDVG